METETQTVATETDDEAKPSPEESGAQDEQDVDWEKLLSEYDPKPAPSTPEANTNQNDDLRSEVEHLKAQLESVQDRGNKADIADLISTVKGEMDLPAYAVRGFIDEQAESDPRIREAFNQRDTNPTAYNKVVKALGKKFASENKSRIDPAATEDSAAVDAALKGSQTTAPETPPPDYSRLSNGEYRQKIMTEYGYDPGV